MNFPAKFFIWIICNIVGFFSASISYHLGIASGTIPVTETGVDPAIIRHAFSQIMLTWIVCGIFSLAGLFLKDKTALFFLMAPAVIPLGYGLSLLVL
jgi:hypothetical protein